MLEKYDITRAEAADTAPSLWPNRCRSTRVVDESIGQQFYICTACGRSKPISAFYLDRRHRRRETRAQCKECTNAANRMRRENSLDKYRGIERQSKTRKRPLWNDELRLRGWRYRLNSFGISEDKFMELFHNQNGRCAICASLLIIMGPQRGRRERACVDHDHDTGKIRGILCGNCNVGIGLLKDDPDLLKKAARYLSMAR